MKRYSFLSVLFVMLTCITNISAQNKGDTLTQTDTVKPVQYREITLSLNYKKIKEIPFGNSGEFGLLSPSAYYLKGGRMFYYGIEARGNNTYLDGMAIDDINNFPVRTLDSYHLYTEQTPINKGFAMGGITTVETARHIDSLTFRGEVSGDYAFNMQAVNGNFFLGIPLTFSKKSRKKAQKPFLILAGNYRWTNNADPVWQQPQRINSAVADSLAANPLRPSSSGMGTFPNAAYVTADDFSSQNVPDNAAKRGIYPYIKLYLPVSKNSSFTLGSYLVAENQDLSVFDNTIFNSGFNGLQIKRNIDSYMRWNQKFTVNSALHISYNVDLQYSNHFTKRSDRNHDNRFFDYNYVGKFTTYRMPGYEMGSITIDSITHDDVMILQSWDYDTLISWTPSNINPDLSAYNQNLFDFYGDNLKSPQEVLLAGGLLNGSYRSEIYGLWKPRGVSYNTYEERGKEKIRAFFQTKIVYKKHHVLLGAVYNRETKRHYTLSPTYLWNLMRPLTNFHLHELDKENPILIGQNGEVDTVIYNRRFDADAQTTFDKNLRKALGLPVDGLDYILIDSYDRNNNTISYYDKNGTIHTIKTPDNFLNLNLFTAGDLINPHYSVVSYAGYNYLGQKVKNSSNPYSFFDDYSINAEKPEYWSVFAQDEFTWKKLHVKLGLRLDVFDARHPVLKDDYSLMPIYTVEQAQTLGAVDFYKPDNIGSDYKVYVDKSFNPNEVAGFRKGDKWYNASGREITEPSELNLGYGLSPYLQHPEIYNLSDENWTPDMTFKPYEKAVNLLPQIAIDYSITKKINLYVFYTSSTQNPFGYSDFRPDIYLYYLNSNQITPNPALKPMRSGKLFAGLNMLIWKNLSGNISYLQTTIDNYFFPKIMEGAYPHSYITFVNNPIRILTNGFQVNLQWLNNTYKGFSGSMSFVKTYPNKEDVNYYQVSDLTFNINANYRFGSQHKFLQGFSTSVFYQYRHGTPYNYTNVNGGPGTKRTPAFQFVNLNIQRDFILSGKATITAYLLIENLFASKNVFKVYSETGNATDDGFLSDPANQAYINNQLSPESFRFLYQQHLYNPDFYDIPRIARFGIILKY